MQPTSADEGYLRNLGRGLRARRPTSASWRRQRIGRWRKPTRTSGTDDYSNVLGAVWRRLRDGEQ